MTDLHKQNPFLFRGALPPSKQKITFIDRSSENISNIMFQSNLCSPNTPVPIMCQPIRKRMNSSDFEAFESSIPPKMHASEEVISTRLSSMFISKTETVPSTSTTIFSNPSSLLNTEVYQMLPGLDQPKCVNKFSIDPVYKNEQPKTIIDFSMNNNNSKNRVWISASDIESSDDEDQEKNLIELPEEMLKELKEIRTTGSLCDPVIKQLLLPKPCLALVPYTPNLNFLQTVADKSKEVSHQIEEMEVLPEESTRFSSSAFTFPLTDNSPDTMELILDD